MRGIKASFHSPKCYLIKSNSRKKCIKKNKLAIITSTEVKNKNMRTYQNSTKEKKKMTRKTAYIIALALSIVAIATIITLSLTLGGKVPTDNKPGDPVDNDPVPPVPVFTVPVDSFSLGMKAELTRIVYMSTMRNWSTHNGLDFLADAGSKVYAVTDGTVKSVVNTSLESTVIEIEHAGGLISYYKGLAEEVQVKVGDAVKSGDHIGAVAEVMSLERDYGSHLHLEMTLKGKLVDPMTYLPELGDK